MEEEKRAQDQAEQEDVPGLFGEASRTLTEGLRQPGGSKDFFGTFVTNMIGNMETILAESNNNNDNRTEEQKQEDLIEKLWGTQAKEHLSLDAKIRRSLTEKLCNGMTLKNAVEQTKAELNVPDDYELEVELTLKIRFNKC